jgi:hypothetical protein
MIVAWTISFSFTGNAIGFVMAKKEKKHRAEKYHTILAGCLETVMF